MLPDKFNLLNTAICFGPNEESSILPDSIIILRNITTILRKIWEATEMVDNQRTVEGILNIDYPIYNESTAGVER